MSNQSYEQAVQIMSQRPDLMDFVGPRPEARVSAAEQFLGVKFPPDYRRFLLEFGAGGFGSLEIMGIIGDNFEKGKVPNGIWYTVAERRLSQMPIHLIAIYSFGNGELACINTAVLNPEGNSPVVVYVPGLSIPEQPYPLVNQDFGDFLLNRVMREIDSGS